MLHRPLKKRSQAKLCLEPILTSLACWHRGSDEEEVLQLHRVLQLQTSLLVKTSRSWWRSLSRLPHPRVRPSPSFPKAPGASLSVPVPQPLTAAATPATVPPNTQSLEETGQGSLPSPELRAGRGAASRLRGKNRCPLQGMKPCSESRHRGTPNPTSPGRERMACPSRGLPRSSYDSVNKEHVLKVSGPVTPKAGGRDPRRGPRSSHSQEIHNGDPRAGR